MGRLWAEAKTHQLISPNTDAALEQAATADGFLRPFQRNGATYGDQAAGFCNSSAIRPPAPSGSTTAWTANTMPCYTRNTSQEMTHGRRRSPVGRSELRARIVAGENLQVVQIEKMVQEGDVAIANAYVAYTQRYVAALEKAPLPLTGFFSDPGRSSNRERAVERVQGGEVRHRAAVAGPATATTLLMRRCWTFICGRRASTLCAAGRGSSDDGLHSAGSTVGPGAIGHVTGDDRDGRLPDYVRGFDADGLRSRKSSPTS